MAKPRMVTRAVAIRPASLMNRPSSSMRSTASVPGEVVFGEAPGALQAMAVMTDGDNTQSQLATWYGEIVLD